MAEEYTNKFSQKDKGEDESIQSKNSEAQDIENQMAILPEDDELYKELQTKLLTAKNDAEKLKQQKQEGAIQDEIVQLFSKLLEGHKTHWEYKVNLLSYQLKNLIGDTLCSAGYIAYLGVFDSAYRREITA